MKVPIVVCDSSSLISLGETCNAAALGFLQRVAGVQFAIPPEVHKEIFLRPVNIPRYEFSALRLNRLLEQGVLQKRSAGKLAAKTGALLSAANSVFSVSGRKLELIQRGEAECIALCAAAGGQALAIDEKTTRLLLEDPEALFERIGAEYERPLSIDRQALAQWQGLTEGIFVMRSSELLAIAASKGFFSQFGALEGKAVYAALVALRNAGCSISSQEIEEISSCWR